jgi:hypothetical protein
VRSAPETTTPIPGQYIVGSRPELFRGTRPGDGSVRVVADKLLQGFGGELLQLYEASIQGTAARFPLERIDELLQLPEVAWIERDFSFDIERRARADVTSAFAPTVVQRGASWGIDRIDQRALPLDETYADSETGLGVHSYIVDTGILSEHVEFGGRAIPGVDFINDGRDGSDCRGHGTGVASSAAGASVGVGVARQATLVSVRVANCASSGFSSNALAAIEWITLNHVRPAVANLSFGLSVAHRHSPDRGTLERER